MADIFKFESPDLINMQRWLKKSPREFNRAAANVVNSTVFKARRKAVDNLVSGTEARRKGFIRRSLRVEKSERSVSLDRISASVFSIDLSGEGRSDGFESLETGGKSKSKRVPTLASRGGAKKKIVGNPVRMNKINKFYKRSMFKGRGKTKHQRTVAMLMEIRRGAIGRQPFIIEGRQRGKLAKMRPGVYKLGNQKRMNLQNPFRGPARKRSRTKRISWMSNAVDAATSTQELHREWKKEADFVLRHRR